jgi:hypothetical protein
MNWEKTLADDGKYIVRLWDGMDGAWCDVSGPLSKADAIKLWMEKTDHGTKMIAYSEIDYYSIFPAGTKMWYNHDNEMFR